MFNNFAEDTKRVISRAKEEMFNLNHPYLGSEHLLLGILNDNNSVSKALKKHNITYKNYRERVIKLVGIGKEKAEWVLYTPVVRDIFDNAIDISNETSGEVTIENLFIALIEEGDGIANRVLDDMHIDLDKIYAEFVFTLPKKGKKKKSLLADIGVDFTDANINKHFDPVIGRDKEIKEIIEILVRKNKSNPILIGEAGVGKTAIIEEISKMIMRGDVPSKLKNKRIINLDMSSVVAGTKYRGEFEEKINKIIKEVESDDDIILFIDEVHTIVGAGGAEGAIDASNIFKPALARGSIKCIGATTLDEYKKYIEKDKALERRFKKVIINEPSLDEVRDIMMKLKPIYERYHHVTIKKDLLDLLINLTDKYIYNYKNPDKTIDILDEVCAHANLKENPQMIKYNELSKELTKVMDKKKECILNNKFKEALKYKQEENALTGMLNELELDLTLKNSQIVTKKDLYDVLSSKVSVPIYELSNKFNAKELINTLNHQVIGQEEAIQKLVNAYFSSLDSDKPFSALLNGPSGIGKTSLALTFAKSIYPHLLRLDMSEYSEEHSVSKLIGAPPGYVGYDDNNYLFNQIKEYPFTVILLDEVERANKAVLNLFFQILDNGELKDAKGSIIHFNHTIILMTSNIENEKKMGFDDSQVNSQLNEYFTVSFINRIDEIITLKMLSEKDIIKIIKEMSKDQNPDKPLKNKEIMGIVRDVNYQEYGARQIKNILKKFKKRKKICKNYSKN